jgi:NET1-associated nuclear protein 1 (U3 small nucleolar RNA-associated protein 17)
MLLKEKRIASYIKILDQGRCMVLYGGDKLFLGQAGPSMDTHTEFPWREVVVPIPISAVDVRAYSITTDDRKKRTAVDIVVGCENGSILIYDDILFKMSGNSKPSLHADIVSRRFHWHRKQVLTVKWSRDGNYIISGGHETVMVIWQLDTGQQQFLPHLSAAIRQISVSGTGSSYAVHLADNSAMVLSASELLPTAYISGLMLRRSGLKKRLGRTPAAFVPHHPTSLALAVPADPQIGSSSSGTATLLQTYDIRAQQQTGRQPLARNNVTSFNVDPTGSPVQEPNVAHLKVSHDGKWLATVDEWIPHQYLGSLCPLGERPSSYGGREIFLKFWTKAESAQCWELVTRIDNPHAQQRGGPGSLLDLQAHPSRPEYSTISSNGRILIWTPKSCHRNGLPVIDQSGSQIFSWTCTKVVECPLPLPDSKFATSAALAYSPDGSVLAFSCTKSPFIQFVDPLAGALLHHAQRGGGSSRLRSQMTFLNHHLIAVSQDLRVYDTVSGELVYALTLPPSSRDVLLTANERDGTFAIVCLLPPALSSEKPKTKRARRGRHQISVFKLTTPSPIFNTTARRLVDLILPLPNEHGYLLVNEESEIIYLRPQKRGPRDGASKSLGFGNPLPIPSALGLPPSSSGLENVLDRMVLSIKERGEEGQVSAAASAATDSSAQQERERDNSTTHKTQSSLADVFDRSGDLSVQQLFERVVGALTGSSAAPLPPSGQ